MRKKQLKNIILDIEHLENDPKGENWYLGTSKDLQGLVVQERTIEDVIKTAKEIAVDLLDIQAEHGVQIDYTPNLQRRRMVLPITLEYTYG